MHDPMTVAFEIKLPFGGYRSGNHVYRPPLITIWHVDPETDGTDDSAGWFMRARHGDKNVLEAIRQAYAFDWDAEWGGWFDKDGKPLFSTGAIVLDMFWHAAFEHFRKDAKKARRFMRKHTFDILHFAENTTDSAHASIVGKYGIEPRQDRIDQHASMIYGCVLRWTRPAWKHPRWHFWHWQFQVHPLQKLNRWLFTRCCKCGKRFGWNESPIGSWSGKEVWHSSCDHSLSHGSVAANAQEQRPSDASIH